MRKKTLLVLMVACMVCFGLLCSCENVSSFVPGTEATVAEGLEGKIVSSPANVREWLLKAYLMKEGELYQGAYLVGLQDNMFASACNALSNNAISKYSKPVTLTAEQSEALKNTARVINFTGYTTSHYMGIYLNRNVEWDASCLTKGGLLQEITSSIKVVVDRVLSNKATYGDLVLIGEAAEIAYRIGDAYVIFNDGTKKSGGELLTTENISMKDYVEGTAPFELKDINLTETIKANMDLLNRCSRFLNLLSAFDGTGRPTADLVASKTMAILLNASK